MGAAFRNQIYALELLRSAGGNLEDCDNEGTTPLILAARAGKREAIDWLLNNGADILVSDHNGKTAEDWAKENGHIEVVELLQSRIRS
jgi:ankyrin repeat protein